MAPAYLLAPGLSFLPSPPRLVAAWLNYSHWLQSHAALYLLLLPPELPFPLSSGDSCHSFLPSSSQKPLAAPLLPQQWALTTRRAS